MHRRRRSSGGLTAALAVFVALVTAAPYRAAADGAIDALVQSVSTDTLNANVQYLQNFGTRQSDLTEGRMAAQWIAARFHSFGADSVYVQGWSRGYAPNVVAIRRGTTRPNEIVLVGGHYDSISRLGKEAPGADDNASGTAAVLECARVLCGSRFESTVQFAAFSAEELGLFGSTAYAAHLYYNNDDLIAMVNVDMIGYRAGSDRRDLDVISNAASGWLRDAAFAAAALHVPELPLVDGAYAGSATSDHVSFWGTGYSALGLFEDSQSSSPYIHTSEDVFGTSYNDDVLATLSTRVAVALLATLAVPATTPIWVQDLALQESGGGIAISWRLAVEAVPNVLDIRVQRAAASAGPYSDRSAALSPAIAMHWVDRDAPASGETVWYRLVVRLASGVPATIGPVALRPEGPRTRVEWAREIAGGEGVEIRWTLAADSGPVRLALYDVAGRRVQLLETSGVPGTHWQRWDRRDASGARVARGVYWFGLEAGSARASRKLTLLQP
jgi:hypothetical protein